jgi:serine/threonine protein phosphatase 1
MKQICFIGDVHGCLDQLDEIVTLASPRAETLVFLGDYVDRGSRSREVIDYLVTLKAGSGPAVIFLAGNHDSVFLRALIADGLDEFLLIGGASTIRSYITEPEPDVLAQLRAVVPKEHLTFLREMQNDFSDEGVIAAHELTELDLARLPKTTFAVYGHLPQRDTIPLITENYAAIDTGCGTLSGGRLTGFFWPAKESVQSRPWDDP